MILLVLDSHSEGQLLETCLILGDRAMYLNLVNQTMFRVQIMYRLGTIIVGNLDIMKITL